MFAALTAWERRKRAHYNVAPTDADTWHRARIYNLWFDHAFLRLFWSNEVEIAPGVFRSNNPTPGRLHRLKRRGIKSILTLRGSVATAHYTTEDLYCREIGLTLHTAGLSDRSAPPPESIQTLIQLFRSIEKPFLFHCKTGADRTGLAAAIYLLAIEDASLKDARKMLSLRYFHVAQSKTGVLDRVLDQFKAEGAGRDFETWVAEGYDPGRVA